MSKNDKKNRTNGTTHSGNVKFPDPVTPSNTPTSDYSFSDADKIEGVTHIRY